MQIVIFAHSLVSCWNHGNAHFLRGIVRELAARGHDVRTFEPSDGWSRQNLVAAHGQEAEADFRAAFPGMEPVCHRADSLDLDAALGDADLVLVHEWNEPSLIARVGRHRELGGRYRLLFHDTHHRALTRSDEIGGLDLDGYDGVLAFGAAVRELYLAAGWSRRVWVWHEAADTALFRPRPEIERGSAGDLVWIGNWGDGERSRELREFLLDPVRGLELAADIFGVRYPEEALAAVRDAGARYRGWIANHRVPEAFAGYRMTVHVPRRPYVRRLRGIPTIRMFEALACGIPLVSAPWDDVEELFRAGEDYLTAASGEEMTRQLARLRADPALGAAIAESGLARIRERHTCAHRVDELMAILASLEPPSDSAHPEQGAVPALQR